MTDLNVSIPKENPVTSTNETTTAPSLKDRLADVLPPWTHWGGPLFEGATATWTTTAGTWKLSMGLMSWPKLIGPGGFWTFGSRDSDHVIGVLRALGAIPEADEVSR